MIKCYLKKIWYDCKEGLTVVSFIITMLIVLIGPIYIEKYLFGTDYYGKVICILLCLYILYIVALCIAGYVNSVKNWCKYNGR
jgi:hypothetical protein